MQVVGLRTRAFAGGTASAGLSVTGATLWGWASYGEKGEPGSWVSLATNQTTAAMAPPYLPAAPGSVIDWQAASSSEARRYLIDKQLSFQVRPSGTTGPNPNGARVALDYIEVRVRYLAP